MVSTELSLDNADNGRCNIQLFLNTLIRNNFRHLHLAVSKGRCLLNNIKYQYLDRATEKPSSAHRTVARRPFSRFRLHSPYTPITSRA